MSVNEPFSGLQIWNLACSLVLPKGMRRPNIEVEIQKIIFWNSLLQMQVQFVCKDLFLILTDQGGIREVRLVEDQAERFCCFEAEISLIQYSWLTNDQSKG